MEYRSLTEKNLLITGRPAVGKTTLIKKISLALGDLEPVGFYTAEIKEGGVRKGFELISLDGRKQMLSHQNLGTPDRVGKYRVDVGGFEDFLESIPFFSPSSQVTILDEIGKMECLSVRFRRLLIDLLDSKKVVLATIGIKGTGFMETLRARRDIKLFEITEGNRDFLVFEVLKEVETAAARFSAGRKR